MATKKTSKSAAPKEQKAPAAPAPAPVIRDNPIMSAEKYLMSVGTRADHIESLIVWAKGKGLTVATLSQWKELFSKF
jgi:hypothetical protein